MQVGNGGRVTKASGFGYKYASAKRSAIIDREFYRYIYFEKKLIFPCLTIILRTY